MPNGCIAGQETPAFCTRARQPVNIDSSTPSVVSGSPLLAVRQKRRPKAQEQQYGSFQKVAGTLVSQWPPRFLGPVTT